MTKNGLLWLSIPVEVKGKFYQKINETKVSDVSWVDNHWKVSNITMLKQNIFPTMKSIYGRFMKYEEKKNF